MRRKIFDGNYVEIRYNFNRTLCIFSNSVVLLFSELFFFMLYCRLLNQRSDLKQVCLQSIYLYIVD
jgi:hypothetical protein